MTDFLTSVENTSLGVWVRESGSIWSYPTIVFLHSLGLTMLVGINAAIDLRLLGYAPGVAVASMKRLFPLMYAGFWLLMGSGIALTVADAATMLVSSIFWIKMALIALALVNLVAIKMLAFSKRVYVHEPVPVRIRLLAATSLFLWLAAIAAGRLTAYLGPSVALTGLN